MLIELFSLGLPFLEMLAVVVAYLCAITLAFGLHEFSHAYTSYLLGDRTAKALGRLTINPIKHLDPIGFVCLLIVGFGWARPVEVNPTNYKNYKKGMLLVSISGVLTNLVLAFVFSGIFFFVYPLIQTSTNLLLVCISFFLKFMVNINLSLMVFNLLPIYPLDGFNFLKALLPNNNKFIDFMLRYGTIILIIFLITPIYSIVYSYITNGVLSIFSSFWGLFV